MEPSLSSSQRLYASNNALSSPAIVLYNSSPGGRPCPPCASDSAVQNRNTATYSRIDRTCLIATPPGTESSLGTGTHRASGQFLPRGNRCWDRERLRNAFQLGRGLLRI